MTIRSRLMGLTAAAAAAVFGSLALASEAAAAIRLKLTYNDELTFALTTVSTSSELDFVLNGKDVTVYSVNGADQTPIGDKATGSGFYYGPLIFKVRLRNGVIDLFATCKTHVTHTQIRTDGQSSCEASITNNLKRGAKTFEYEMPSLGTVQVYKITLSNIRCELSRE